MAVLIIPDGYSNWAEYIADLDNTTSVLYNPIFNAIDFTGTKLLLVEDMEINREIASILLENAGFVIDEATNGEEAIEMVKRNDYDVILMDIQMPIMDGYQATKAIRKLDDKKKASIPILAVTANAFREDVKKALDAGMNDHISKPIDLDNLLVVLAKTLHKE